MAVGHMDALGCRQQEGERGFGGLRAVMVEVVKRKVGTLPQDLESGRRHTRERHDDGPSRADAGHLIPGRAALDQDVVGPGLLVRDVGLPEQGLAERDAGFGIAWNGVPNSEPCHKAQEYSPNAPTIRSARSLPR